MRDRWETVAIVGVGLIGGSIGQALLRRGLSQEVVGVGRRPESLRRARRCGAVTSTTTDLARGVRRAEVVVVCTPVERIVEFVRRAAESCPAGALITDAGSVKGAIVDPLDRPVEGRLGREATFVGAHPLAGSDRTGVEFARDDLFVDRACIVTPGKRTAAEAADRCCRFWASLGCRIYRMTPAEHDAAVAAVSHVPHVVAAAIAASTPPQLLELVGTGWLDTTRVAGGDVELWRQILQANRRPVLRSLREIETWLAAFRRALDRRDFAAVAGLLQAGKDHRDAVGS